MYKIFTENKHIRGLQYMGNTLKYFFFYLLQITSWENKIIIVMGIIFYSHFVNGETEALGN